jgi:hypothetical protein
MNLRHESKPTIHLNSFSDHKAEMMSDTTCSAQDWLNGFAHELGLDAPDGDTIDNLLNLAGVAAHDSERIAAPIACWMIGLAGIDPPAALALAQKYVSERGT